MKSFSQVFAAAAALAGLLFFSGAAFAPWFPQPQPEIQTVLTQTPPAAPASEPTPAPALKPWASKLEDRFRTERSLRSAV